jgi:hypothetical protein
MITQMHTPLPVVTPRGKGWAYFIIDRSQEHYLEWVVFLDDGGCCWTIPNTEIRIQDNWSMGRTKIHDFSYQPSVPSPKANQASYPAKNET